MTSPSAGRGRARRGFSHLADPGRREEGVHPASREVPRRREARRAGRGRASHHRGAGSGEGAAEGPRQGASERPPDRSSSRSGRLRSREAVKKILPFADSADEGLRQAALFALANIGDPAAAPVLSRSRVASSFRERSQAPSLYLLYARRLIESGRTAEGLEAARARSRPTTAGRESRSTRPRPWPSSSRPSGRGPARPPRAPSTAPTGASAARPSTLAERIPGSEATLRWVEKAAAPHRPTCAPTSSRCSADAGTSRPCPSFGRASGAPTGPCAWRRFPPRPASEASPSFPTFSRCSPPRTRTRARR